MLLNLSGTIVPWVLGTLIILVLFTALGSVKAWRDMKRSPYFFLRRQAEKRLQNYSITSFVFILVSLFVTTYAKQNPQDNITRMSMLLNDKPPQEELSEAVAAAEKAEAVVIMAAVEPEASPSVNSLRFQTPVESSVAKATNELPGEFDNFEPTAELSVNTNLTPLVFSTEVTDEFDAVDPRNIFPEGFFTIYATFDYEEMSDGMAWSWVWRRDGDVISGGNELWAYGDEGPGYVYLNPEEGFERGEYEVEVWVNGELLTASSLVVNNAAISAGN